MRTVRRESWRHYRRRYLATGLAILLGVGFCSALLTLATAARRGAAAAASTGPTGRTTSSADQGSDAVSALTNGVDVLGGFLLAFAVVALVVAGLVISNTFRIVLAQRSKDLALLRCLGAQRAQVFGATLEEGLLLGALAGILGTVVGIAFGILTVQVVNLSPAPVELQPSLPTPMALVVPFLAGLVTTGMAAGFPALAAACRPPLAAVVGSEVSDRSFRLRDLVLTVVGAILLGVTGAVLLAVAMTRGDLTLGLAGGVLSYLAVLVVSPVVVPALIGLVGRGLRRLPRRWRGGVPVRVAVLESKRSPRRTAGAVTAFTVGVTLITMLCVGAASVAETQARAVDRIAPVDVVLSGGAVPTGLAGRLSTLDEVGDVVVVGGGYASIGERRVQVASLSGPPAARVVRDGLLREQITDPHRIVVPVAAQSAVRRDSSARITLRGRSDSVRLSPVYASLPSGPLLVSPAVLDRLGVRKRPEALFLRLSDAADPVSSLQAIGAVVAAGRDRGLVVAGSYGERTTYHQLVTTMLVTAVAMLAVAVVIALVGLGNTLSLSITERTREYGLLRSLGLTRRQLRLLLTTESLLLALAAVGIGIVLGIGYGWIGTVVLLHGALNHAPTLVVPIGQLGVVGGVAVVAGLAASLLPARHGLALSPVEALARD